MDEREAFQAQLKAAGIPTAVHYPIPLNEQPAYAHLRDLSATPVANDLARRVMSLPMHADLDETAQYCIVTALYDSDL